MSRPSIAQLNDLLRETLLTGQVLLTEGIHSLTEEQRSAVLTKVRTFSEFTEDNDPYCEHDFGAFDQDGVGKVFWKIDYYDLAYEAHSPDPADPKVTRRVLTIMLAREY